MAKFDVLLVDVPWRYSDTAAAGERGAAFKYPTLSIDAVKELPVSDVASDDSMIFMWGTWPLLKESIDVIETWGFKYKTGGFTWIKTAKSGNPSMGMGSYTRSNSEFCLLGVRGNVKASEWIVDRSVSSAIVSPRLAHSEKPSEVCERIERLVGPSRSKLELFARARREGWESLGNHLDGVDIRASLPELIARENEA
jgi:N6-adenosine-specific RNA methylase IME4